MIITLIINTCYGILRHNNHFNNHHHHHLLSINGNPIATTDTTLTTTTTPLSTTITTTESPLSSSSSFTTTDSTQQQQQQQNRINSFVKNLRKNVFATNPFHYSYGGKMMNLIQPLQQQQHQQQKLEQETENPVQFDDCLGVQQPRKSQSRSDLNIVAQQQPSMPFSTSTPTPSEQQLEQFIQSLKPQNMDADIEDDNADSGKDDNINKTNDLMNTGDDENQPRKHSDFEIDLIDSSIKPQQQQNRNFENERFEQQNLMIDSISAKNGQQMSNNQQKNNRRGQPQRFKAAVLTRYSMEYRPIDSNLLAEHHHHEIEGDDLNAGDERIIEVLPQSRPLQIHFKSPSNRIKVVQSSINDNGKQEENIHQEPEIERTEEEPRLYYQQIRKPILQQVHEIIMPYRKVIQEVKPVVEQVHTVVTSSRSPQPFTVQSKFRKSNSINQSTTTATATELNKFNRSPISRFKQIQQQQKQQHPNQKEQFQSSTINEDSPTVTLSPLLIGVEQMVEPNVGGDNGNGQQQQQHLTQKPMLSTTTSTLIHNNDNQQQRQLMKELLLKILPQPHHYGSSSVLPLSQSSLIDGSVSGGGGHYGSSSRPSLLSSSMNVGGTKSVI